MSETVLWSIFGGIIAIMMIADLFFFHRKTHAVNIKEAIAWSVVWVCLALAFNVVIYYWKGTDAALKFLTGYLVEESLSVDNLFVFLLIFSYFKIQPQYQHKILFWGIVGAIVMRALFIGAGIALVSRFHWIFYVFGVLLVISGVKLALEKDKEIDPEKNFALKLFRRFMPVTKEITSDRFFIRQGGKRYATPLFVALIIVETTDLIFAIDSIPAVLAITTDPLIVYTSNLFAILGLRSMYFVLAGIMKLFHYLHYGLSIIIVYVGIKMLITDFYKIPTFVTLTVLVSIIGLSVALSVLRPPKKKSA